MRRWLGLGLVVAATGGAVGQGTGSAAGLGAPRVPVRTVRFVHGLWFDGTAFVAKDVVARGGLFSAGDEGRVDEVVDLKGGWVVPPFGDAHEHNFDSVERTPAVTAKYLKDGIFYAQGMTDVLDGARAVVTAGLVDTPSTVDVTYAHGGLTGVNGHPKEVYEALALGFYYPKDDAQKAQVVASHLRARQAYWEIDSAADLAAKWPGVLAGHPDLIKVYMSDSEHYTPEMHAHPRFAAGLDPALVRPIVERAHAAGLKVAAHVDTPGDVHVALLAGVDELAHLPGYCRDVKDEASRSRVTDEDVALIVKQHVTVIPTASICDGPGESAEQKRLVRETEMDNLGRLKRAGAMIVVGSDHYSEDSLLEATYLQGLGLWTNAEMLRMWAVATPRDIFPGRQIGRLEPGYEASFLVLRGDPLKDWKATGMIAERWKAGRRMAVAEPAPASGASSAETTLKP